MHLDELTFFQKIFFSNLQIFWLRKFSDLASDDLDRDELADDVIFHNSATCDVPFYTARILSVQSQIKETIPSTDLRCLRFAPTVYPVILPLFNMETFP